MCGPHASCLWADRNLGLSRFTALRVLTLHEYPSRCAHWPARLPVSLRSLLLDVLPTYELGAVRDNRSVRLLPRLPIIRELFSETGTCGLCHHCL